MSSSSWTTYPDTLETPDPISRIEEEQQGYLARGQAQIRELTRDREARFVLLALAAGFGVGFLLGGALGGSHRPGWDDRMAAEGIGRRLMEKVDQYLPEAISSRFSS